MLNFGRALQLGFGIVMVYVLIACGARGNDSYGLSWQIGLIALGALAIVLAARRGYGALEKRLGRCKKPAGGRRPRVYNNGGGDVRDTALLRVQADPSADNRPRLHRPRGAAACGKLGHKQDIRDNARAARQIFRDIPEQPDTFASADGDIQDTVRADGKHEQKRADICKRAGAEHLVHLYVPQCETDV